MEKHAVNGVKFSQLKQMLFWVYSKTSRCVLNMVWYFFTISVQFFIWRWGLLLVPFNCRKQIIKGSRCLVMFLGLKTFVWLQMLTADQFVEEMKNVNAPSFLNTHIPRSVKMFTVLLVSSATIHEITYFNLKIQNTYLLIYIAVLWTLLIYYYGSSSSIRPQPGSRILLALSALQFMFILLEY